MLDTLYCSPQLESQTTFGSMFKTRIEGNNMFCDFYNPSNLTYCKRLRVMCPEHTKAPVVKDSEVRLQLRKIINK